MPDGAKPRIAFIDEVPEIEDRDGVFHAMAVTIDRERTHRIFTTKAFYGLYERMGQVIRAREERANIVRLEAAE